MYLYSGNAAPNGLMKINSSILFSCSFLQHIVSPDVQQATEAANQSKQKRHAFQTVEKLQFHAAGNSSRWSQAAARNLVVPAG